MVLMASPFTPAADDESCKFDKLAFKQIFIDHWDSFKNNNKRYDNQYYDSLIEKMINCGNPDKMGFAQFFCPDCFETTRKIAFSCKSSFCLSCAKVYTDRWVEFIGRRLIPGVVYRHFVLTMPECLRIWFYRNQKLLSVLMRTGQEFLLDLCSFLKNDKLDIGAVIVLQTFGRPGNYNPHLHIIFTAGGIDTKGKWKPITFFPWKVCNRKWQYHLLKMLKREVKDPKIYREVNRAWMKYKDGFIADVQKGNVPPGGGGLATYLAKYLVSPPISVRRIEHYDGKEVSYYYRDHKTKKVEHVRLPVEEFIGRMVQHILPKGFQRIRYYGFHSNVRYAKMREQIRLLKPSSFPEDPEGYRVKPRKKFEQLFKETFGKSPLICPKCGRELELEYIKHPKYGTLYDFWSSGWVEGGIDEPQKEDKRNQGRRAVRRPERMVQIPLPEV